MIKKEIKPVETIIENDGEFPHENEEAAIQEQIEIGKVQSVRGQFVDVFNKEIFPAEITIHNKQITQIKRLEYAPQHYILPGFIDAHIHIESSMLVPTEFAKIAVTHGTVATVSDPHEIANVCGIEGVDFMIDNAKQSPLKFNFGAPSCVPATNFETSGAVINSKEIEQLLARKEIRYLSEMMNFPGVLFNDPEVMAKISAAKAWNKPIDGHAPGLRNEDAKKYAAAGISTDHECVALDEALDKINCGMYILIREGSAAKNFEALVDLFKSHPERIMFCSDDKHPDELISGHINQLVVRAIAKGYNVFDVLHAACILPVLHYNLDVGLLRINDPADFIIVENLKDFPVLETYIDGELVAQNGISFIETETVQPINNFKAQERELNDFKIKANRETTEIKVNVIEALEGQLITNGLQKSLSVINQEIYPDLEQDILKIGVVNRYVEQAPIALGFVKNFGLKRGAMASSVAHDSHNIVFVGCDDQSICDAVNAIIKQEGGISVCDGSEIEIMGLPVAGLMTSKDALATGKEYERLAAAAKSLGSQLSAPFMTLSFMALPVIPELKITDKGLFDVRKFEFTNLEVE